MGNKKGGAKMKTSYHKRWDGNGVCYTQAIKINKKIANQLRDCIDAEIAQGLPNKDKYVSTPGYETFLKPINPNNRIIFLNHTQLKFVNMFLKLQLKDRNTCLLNY